jgi:hypothetical protein
VVRGLSQETVDEITRLYRQAEFSVRDPLIRYLDPNVPRKFVSTYCLDGKKSLYRTCNQWCNPFSTGCLDPYLVSNMQENIGMTHRPEGKLTEI